MTTPASTLTVGTRGSPLALAQAERAAARLRQRWPQVAVSIRVVSTAGDAAPETPLTELGAGVFTRELEAALLRGEVDVAAHSLKDLAAADPKGVAIAAVLQRDDPRDVLVSRTGAALDALPAGAVVGTGSPRRAALVRARRPDVAVAGVRGNVGTRLRKLHEGQYDALVLAAAGLLRLDRAGEVTEWLDPLQFVPAAGQGAIALQTRADDAAVRRLVAAVDHKPTRQETAAERAFLRALGGGCRTPAAVYGSVMNASIRIAGVVASADGARVCRDITEGAAVGAEALGRRLARSMLDAGAAALLAEEGL